MFVNREDELEELERAWSSGRAELLVIYGRRRIGKTSLIERFCRGRSYVYLLVNFTDEARAVKDLVDQLLSQVELEFKPQVDGFRDLYSLLCKLAERRRRLILVIDEFQRLHEAGGVTILQEFWDRGFSKTDVMLVLMGSSVGVMEDIGLSYSSPLYGRATKVVKLSPFKYRASRLFFKSWSPEDRVRGYAVFGGVPGYLRLVDSSRSLKENIESLALRGNTMLREEPITMLTSELRDIDRYMAVLEAIAQGASTLGEVAGRVGMKTSDISKYVRVLERQLDVVERYYPLLSEERGRARYRLSDNYMAFWFRYVRPNLHLLELGLHERVLERVMSTIDEYTSRVFEDVALEHMATLARAGEIAFTKIGRWWRGGVEIDVVAVDEGASTAYFAECKWTSEPASRRDLYKLVSKSEEFPWRRGRRRDVYLLYSRSGFTFSGDSEVKLYSLNDLEEHFDHHKPQVQLD